MTRIDYFGDRGRDPLELLSRREHEVLQFVVSGYTSKEIGSRLGISAASVDTYRRRLMVKLDIDDLPGLVRFAIRHGSMATVSDLQLRALRLKHIAALAEYVRCVTALSEPSARCEQSTDHLRIDEAKARKDLAAARDTLLNALLERIRAGRQ